MDDPRSSVNEETRTLSIWLAELAEGLDLDLDLDEDGVHALLDLARDAAHQVTRPAAPLTTFMVGVAVGRGASVGATAAAATQLALTRGETGTSTGS